MIIDAHTHIFERGSGGPFNLASGPDDLVREMDAAGVDVSVVLPLAGTAGNEFVEAACARSGGRLVALYNPDFSRGRAVVREMAAFFDVHAPRGLKIHPREQRVNVQEPAVRDVLEWAAERGVPVLFDLFPYGPSLDDDRLAPLAYHRLAQELPQLRMVLAHAGGYRVLEVLMVAKANANVFVDVSFTPVYFGGSSLAADCAFLCRRLAPGRVLYGSDFPHVRFADALDAGRALLAEADEDTRRAVMGGAAAQLFAIDAGR